LKFKHIEYENENGNLIMFYHSDKSEQFWLMEVISKLNFLLIVYFNEALPEQMAKPKMIETLLFIRQHNNVNVLQQHLSKSKEFELVRKKFSTR
jgi:hypothetical protein